MNKIKIGLFGFGVVGQGIFQVLSKSRNAHAEIVKICVRSNKPRSIDASYFTTDPEVILSNPEIDLIVEVIDDAAASYKIVKAALQKGIPVVSGNKAMLARHLPELIDLQKKHNVALLYDASSCGSIPVIRNLEEYYDNDLLPDLHLRHLDYPRLGHPVRPRKRGQDQTGRPSGQGQRPEVHDVRHARIRHPRQIHLQRR